MSNAEGGSEPRSRGGPLKLAITDEPNPRLLIPTRTTGQLQVKKLTEHAFVPVRGSALAAGYDLKAAYDATIPAQGKALVKTDIAIAVPEGCYGRIVSHLTPASAGHHVSPMCGAATSSGLARARARASITVSLRLW